MQCWSTGVKPLLQPLRVKASARHARLTALTTLRSRWADGVVGSNDVRNNTPRTDFLNGWHMVTVTTLASTHVSRPWPSACNMISKYLHTPLRGAYWDVETLHRAQEG